MPRRTLAILLSLLAFGTLAASAEDFWVKKDWKRWTKEDCNRMLNNSPWAKKWGVERSNNTAAMPGISGAARSGSAGDAKELIEYTIQMRSSIAIREALARQEQIQKKYDKLSEEQKKDLDKEAEDLLGRKYDDVITVHVEYDSNIQPYAHKLAHYWQDITPGSIPLTVFLINERGDRILPVKFESPKSGAYEFDLYFPRVMNNEPIVRPGDKNLELQFPHPPIGRLRGDRALIEFKIEKMVWDGKSDY